MGSDSAYILHEATLRLQCTSISHQVEYSDLSVRYFNKIFLSVPSKCCPLVYFYRKLKDSVEEQVAV